MNIGIRYAKALFQIGSKQQKIDHFMNELNLLRQLFSESKEMKSLFENRLADKQLKIDVLTRVCTGSGLSEETTRLMTLIINNGREIFFEDIVAAYDQLYDDYRGIVKVDVHTAYELGPDAVNALKSRIKELFSKEPALNIKQDKSIIGGVKLKVGWTIYDGTIKTQLKDFTDSIKI